MRIPEVTDSGDPLSVCLTRPELFNPCRYDELEKEHKHMMADKEHELRTTVNKHKANIEFLKQEHDIANVKVKRVDKQTIRHCQNDFWMGGVHPEHTVHPYTVC